LGKGLVNEQSTMGERTFDIGSSDGKEKKSLKLSQMLIPALFDNLETSLKNITLTLISASVTQMFRSTLVVFSATLAYFFLKKKLYRHHIFSILLIIIGIVLGGLSQLMNKSGRISAAGVVIVLIA
jgi:drug/metabolite transporter (DMT)-like permease